jgi:hypothetical protein
VIVCAAFLVGAWAVVRRELAPRRRARAAAKSAAKSAGAPTDKQAAEPADRGHGGS